MSDPLDEIHHEICGCTYKMGVMGIMGNYWGRVVVSRCAGHQREQDMIAAWIAERAAKSDE